MSNIKKWISNKWQKIKNSKSFLAIIMLFIGISYTISYYEFRDLRVAYQKEVGALGTPVAHASSEQDVTVMVQKEEEIALVSSTSPAVQTATFTAYNAEVGQTDSDPFTMASGKRVYEGAVANNCLPFGTKIEVNGKVKIVEDRMNSRYDCDHFDIYMESHDEAIKFGKQELTFKKLER